MSDALQFDPALKQILLRETGDPLGTVVSEEIAELEVPVIARLVDPTRSVTWLNTVTRFGRVVTGRVPLAHLVDVHEDTNVASLKASRVYSPTLATSVAEINAGRASTFGQETRDATGRGVVIASVDW